MPKTSGIPIKSVPALTDEIVGLDNSGTPQTSNFTFQSIVDGVSDNFPADSPLNSGWPTLGYAPNTITPLGNGSYSLVFNSVDLTSITSVGMKMKGQRTQTAPTQCTSLNGTNQYYNKTSPAGMTWTDDYTISGWVKMTANPTTNPAAIGSRYNGTSGWILRVELTGQLMLIGLNGSASNYSYVQSNQSLSLNRWVYITLQLDMSAFTATTTTSYVMMGGVNVPATVSRAGTNPTALIQAGDLNVGTANSGTGYSFFNGKISQLAFHSAKVAQATALAYKDQTLTGAESNLASAYTFNNSVNDLNTTNANNLTAQNSAVATNADTPFTNPVTGTNITAGTTNNCIIMSQSFSTNTTYIVQVPEGETLPSSGGMGVFSYSTQDNPYGFPKQAGKWDIETVFMYTMLGGATGIGGVYNVGSAMLSVPAGSWNDLSVNGNLYVQDSDQITGQTATCLSTTVASYTPLSTKLTSNSYAEAGGASSAGAITRVSYKDSYNPTTQTPVYLNIKTERAVNNTGFYVYTTGIDTSVCISARNAYA